MPQSSPEHSPDEINKAVEQAYRDSSRKILATLIRWSGDFDLAEDAMQEAFAAAVRSWESTGLPDCPEAWLLSTARNRLIDAVRKQKLTHDRSQQQREYLKSIQTLNHSQEQQTIPDDRLRLIFTCCHPAIERKVQIPLVLREVCGMSTEAIADAFLTNAAAMAQRLVRGKKKIKLARIPFEVPDEDKLTSRLESVLDVIYLVFNEGYSPSHGQQAVCKELSGEAIRLTRLLLELLPDPEVQSLLALMLFHESRRKARVDSNGDIVLLDDQDRRRWDQELIHEASQLVNAVWSKGTIGSYWIQAAIAAAHSTSPSAQDTNWSEIERLYQLLLQVEDSPIARLNHAVAAAMAHSPDKGLELLEPLLALPQLENYALAYAAHGDLLARTKRPQEAIAAYQNALRLAQQGPQQRFLMRKLAELQQS